MEMLIMTPVLERDRLALHNAVSSGGDDIQVALSRETAEMLAAWMDAQARGQEVVITHGLREVSPTQAASMMGMSRAQVRNLMDEGKLPFRMVGAHHRIRVDAIHRWLDIEDARQEAAMAELIALQNELGLTD
jgi:excisionase family DNA binding protein